MGQTDRRTDGRTLDRCIDSARHTTPAVPVMPNSHRPPDMTRQCCLCRVRRCELSRPDCSTSAFCVEVRPAVAPAVPAPPDTLRRQHNTTATQRIRNCRIGKKTIEFSTVIRIEYTHTKRTLRSSGVEVERVEYWSYMCLAECCATPVHRRPIRPTHERLPQSPACNKWSKNLDDRPHRPRPALVTPRWVSPF